MEIKKYPDGTSYVRDPGNGDTLTFKINSYEDLWHLNQLVDAHNSCNSHIPTISIPNLIDAQADRQFGLGQSSGLKLVCKFLNGLDAYFKIFHPHNPEVVEALMDNVEIISNFEFISSVMDRLDRRIPETGWFNSDNLILMSSDAGGFKPLMKMCDQLDWKGETYSASKARNHETKKLTQLISRLDFNGKDILIVDDICVYGGTFKGLATMLRARNVGKIYLAVSHMTVQNLGDDPVTNYFDKVFTTNSKFDSYYKGYSNAGVKGMKPKNLEIIKLF